MFCPHCGYRQASDEVQFCSTCGFALKGVRQLLATDGAPTFLTSDVQPEQLSPRRKGINRGALLWLIGAVLVPLLSVLDADKSLIGAVAVLLFIGGFARIVYALLAQSKHPAPSNLLSQKARSVPEQFARSTERASLAALAASETHFNSSARRRSITGELSMPPSVTDHTTRLLDKDE